MKINYIPLLAVLCVLAFSGCQKKESDAFDKAGFKEVNAKDPEVLIFQLKQENDELKKKIEVQEMDLQQAFIWIYQTREQVHQIASATGVQVKQYPEPWK